MRVAALALALVFSPPAFSQDCQTPELLRGKPQSIKQLIPAPQPPKGEFETSADYAARTATRPLADTVLLRLEPSAGTFEYDADKQHFNWKRKQGWSEAEFMSGMISVYSDFYAVLKGPWNDKDVVSNIGKRPRVGALAVEEKEVNPGARFKEFAVGVVLYEHPHQIPDTLATSTVAIEKAAQIKKGLRVVTLIAPTRTPPYFLRESGSTASLGITPVTAFDYSILVADVKCIGILDGAGNLLGSYGFAAVE